MRIAAIVLVALAVTSAAGCGGRERASATHLTIVAVNPNVGQAVFHLSCAPAGGDVPSPARACAALERKPNLVTRPKPFACVGGTTSWWDIMISATLRGRIVDTRTASCWTRQMELIRRLGIARSLDAHLLARRSERVLAGTERTIAAGLLRPGDRVVCDVQGQHLEAGVPVGAEVDTGVGVAFADLTVTRHRDGSVTASCG